MSQLQEQRFLPDFCRWSSVLTVLVLSELFAIIVVVAQMGQVRDPWSELALISLFMQWVGVSCTLFLCVTRRLLLRLPMGAALSLAYLGLLLIILLLSDASYRFVLGELLPKSALDYSHYMLRNLLVGATLCALVLRYFYVQHQWSVRLKAESEARLQALQARIRPHFLFNTINTIVSLVRARPDQAEGALLDMADLFRAALAEAGGLVPIADELTLVRGYLAIEQLRLDQRLRVEYQLDDLPGDALVPALSLQPIVENAVYHGIESLPEGGVVRIAGWCQGNSIKIEISNPVSDNEGRAGSGSQIAQESVHQRLLHHFPDADGMQVGRSGGEYLVKLSFPYRSSVA